MKGAIALETVAFQATAPGAAAVPFAAVAGNSLRIRDSEQAWMLSIASYKQAASFIRVTSPLLHDAQVGITQESVANAVALNQVETMFEVPQPLTPQDNLSVTGTGSAVAGDIETGYFHVLYEGLAGVAAKLIDWQELQSRGIEWYCPRVTVTPTAAGGYTGSIGIASLEDQFKANQEYAIIGCNYDATFAGVAGIRFVSPDFGNLGIVCPRTINQSYSARYFIKLSKVTGMPCIPVINASQKDSIFLSALGNENAAVAATLNVVMIRLSGKRK